MLTDKITESISKVSGVRLLVLAVLKAGAKRISNLIMTLEFIIIPVCYPYI